MVWIPRDCSPNLKMFKDAFLTGSFVKYLMEINEDTVCHNCKKEESIYLLFWKKIYPDMGEAILDPSIICKTCKQKFTGSFRFFERRPVLVSFEELAKKDDEYIRLLFLKKKPVTTFRFHFGDGRYGECVI